MAKNDLEIWLLWWQEAYLKSMLIMFSEVSWRFEPFFFSPFISTALSPMLMPWPHESSRYPGTRRNKWGQTSHRRCWPLNQKGSFQEQKSKSMSVRAGSIISTDPPMWKIGVWNFQCLFPKKMQKPGNYLDTGMGFGCWMDKECQICTTSTNYKMGFC